MREVGTGLVKVDIDGHRADVILNRLDKRNAMNRDLLSDLTQAIEEVEAEDSVTMNGWATTVPVPGIMPPPVEGKHVVT